MKKLLLFYIVLLSVFVSCKPEPPEPEPEQFLFGSGAYITCEGNFNSVNGDISYYNVKTDEIFVDIFAMQNNETPLGDIVQSLSFSGDYAFIVSNNSKKIEIVDKLTFTHEAVMENISYPRYIINIDDKKSYLTNGSYPGEVLVIDNELFSVTKSIAVGNSPENLISAGNKVYVANGAWGADKTISVIDSETDEITATVEVWDGTCDLAADFEGNIWVLCSGKTVYDENWNVVSETDSKLMKINSANLEISDSLTIGATGDYFSPIRLAADSSGNYIFYAESDGIYKLDVRTTPLSPQKIISGTFYGLEISTTDNNIYVFSDNGFTQAGTLNIYNQNGELIKSDIKTGIGPNGAVFR